MKLLVIGGSGFLGRELVRRSGAAATFHRTPVPGGHPLDIRDRAATAALVRRLDPDVIVNAAYVHTDWRTTADGAMHVAAAWCTSPATPCSRAARRRTRRRTTRTRSRRTAPRRPPPRPPCAA